MLLYHSFEKLSSSYWTHLIDTYKTSFNEQKYLVNRIPTYDKRFSTFQECFKLLQQRNVKILVETGTSRNGLKNCRGDGCSTILFAEWAKDHNASLFSVDIDADAITESKAATTPINSAVEFITQDSVAFLANFNRSIDFLYLDSYDFDFHDPLPSQLHHLKEIEAVYPFLHENSVIMIDDCDLPHGGKGKLVIQYLLSKGWKIHLSGYQILLLYGKN